MYIKNYKYCNNSSLSLLLLWLPLQTLYVTSYVESLVSLAQVNVISFYVTLCDENV